MRVLTVNPGSSSLRLALFVDGERRADADPPPGDEGLARFLNEQDPPDAVGLRVVHGGPAVVAPTVVDDEVADALRAACPLAPLHNPAALDALALIRRDLPGVPVVACVDTAFHSTVPEAARTWALPPAWQKLGVRRYGFHGLAHASNVRAVARLLGTPPERLRIVSCHIGSGASLCAVEGGRSVDTTMGFTPVDGVVMATRGGSIDPGAVVWCMGELGLSTAEAAIALEREAGLLGLTGLRGGMRAVEEAAAGGDEVAVAALAVHDHRLRAAIAAMAAALGGLDAVVFSGGVGQHSARTRRAAVDGMGFLGLAVDPALNAVGLGRSGRDRVISPDGSRVAVAVVAVREDEEMARAVTAVLDPAGGTVSR